MLFSCDSTDDESSQGSQTEQEIEVITQKLSGEWKLVSSMVDGENVSVEDFECLKNSEATFSEDKYFIKYVNMGSSSGLCSMISERSGTYSVIDSTSISFFGSDDKVELIDESVHITYSNEASESQTDVFIRKDSEALVVSDQEKTTNIQTSPEEETDKTEKEEIKFDGSAVIEKLKGTWTHESSDECSKKNTLEFKSDEDLEFVQYKATFNRNDLLDYNIGVSYPIPSKFSAKVSKGRDQVTFDTEASCQFIKKSQLNYIVKDDKTVLLEGVSAVTIEVESDDTIVLIYKYLDSDSKDQTVEYSYRKMVK